MQSSGMDSNSLPGTRALGISDYIDIVRRQKSWIIGPAFAFLVISVVVAFLWPDTYVSTAVVRVVPPQVPRELVPTNVNSAMSQRINAMYQQISSTSELTNVLNTYNLYPKERNRKPDQDLVEQLRRSIRISNVASVARAGRDEEVAAFQVSVTYENRHLAQKVAEHVVGRFITENARERTSQSAMTTDFLRDQVQAAKTDLDALESKLASFRQSFQGRLPEQSAQNAMQLNALEQRLANIHAAASRVAQEKMLLESDMRTIKTQRATLVPTPEQTMARKRNSRLDQLENEVLRLETVLASYREQYKENHPDVKRVTAQLNIARKVRDKVAAETESQHEKDSAAASTRRGDPLFERESRELDLAMDRIQAQLEAKKHEAEAYNKQVADTERQIRTVQSKIESAPASEQQYSDLLREQALAKMRFEEMKRKQNMSTVATELERRNQGETLELLDNASLPMTPTEPNRLMIIGAGTAAGIVFGLIVAGAREARDTSLKNLKDVRAYTQLPVLGSIPLLENDLVVRRRRRIAWLGWSTACLCGILVMTGSVVYYYTTKV